MNQFAEAACRLAEIARAQGDQPHTADLVTLLPVLDALQETWIEYSVAFARECPLTPNFYAKDIKEMRDEIARNSFYIDGDISDAISAYYQFSVPINSYEACVGMRSSRIIKLINKDKLLKALRMLGKTHLLPPGKVSADRVRAIVQILLDSDQHHDEAMRVLAIVSPPRR